MKNKISKEKLSRLSKIIDYEFKNVSLLELALTHKSASDYVNNERLEFLGDAVLSLVCADYLFLNANMNEGCLSALRANFVCKENLSSKAREINLQDYIFSEKAMKRSGTMFSASVLSDALEAIFGAVYLDSGVEAAKKVILKVLGEPSLATREATKDFKTRLQELMQGLGKSPPLYTIVEIKGPAHSPTFFVGVKSDEKILAFAEGENKKTAEQNAANKALEMLSIN